MQLAAQGPVRPPAVEELQSRCLKHQAETSTLKSNASLLQSQIASLSQAKHAAQRDLQRAEKSLDRQRMEFEKAEKAWREERVSLPVENGKHPGSGNATPNGKVEDVCIFA